MDMKVALIVFCSVLVCATAIFIPKVLPNGTMRFNGETRAMAVYALRQVESYGLEGVQGVPVLSTTVDSVEQINGSQPCKYVLGGNETKFRLATDYRATVRLRTIFGFTYGRIEVTCRTMSWL